MYVEPVASGGRYDRSTQRRRQPLKVYVMGALRQPRWALSDIAIDRPWLQGTLLFAVGMALTGLALGATGLPYLGAGVRGAALGVVVVPTVSLAAFFAVSVVLFVMGRNLEGMGGYPEVASALLFALLPLWLLAPAAALRLLPGAFDSLAFFLAVTAIALWTVRLSYLAVREAHRFTGTQAILTMMTPITLAALLVMAGFFLTALVVLVGLI